MVKNALSKKMWRDLWLLRFQTLTTSILIVCGISLLVSEWSAYESLKSARDSYYREYRFSDLFAEFKRASKGSLKKLLKIPGIKTIVPRISTEGLVNLPNRSEPSVGRFLSLPSGSQPLLNQIYLRKGRLPIDSSEGEVVVHEGFAKANRLSPGDKFEVIIQGQSEQLRIVGIGLSPEYVYALSPSAPLPDDLHFGVFWVTEKMLQRLVKINEGYNSLLVEFDPIVSIHQVMAKMDELLRPYGSLGSYERSRQISNMFVEDEISEQRVSSIFIPAIFLGIASFLINIITSRLITLQRAQIATFKSLGYSRLEVSLHYLKLVSIMALMGTLPGLGLGALLGRWMSSTYEAYFHFPVLKFTISPLASVIGIVAGVLPAIVGAYTSIRSVYKISPAVAMRPLTPPSYHVTFFERWNLNKIFQTSQKMIIRHLLQKPIRLFQVVLSLSAALAIVIASGAWADMIQFLLKTQFQRIQKEDLSIKLIRPQSWSVIQELKNIPGVMEVEAYREIPVRIRFKNFKRELQLTGRPEKSSMRKLLNLRLVEVPLSINGITLGRFFQKKWGIKKGDFIQLQPLEGENKIYQVQVTNFSDELMGLNANMQIKELWKMMNEQTGFNVFSIKADPRKLNEIYNFLKKSPQVESVHLKNALYKGFNETFGQVIRSASLVLMVASLIISVGIIYNSLQVSFSERSWELASLRVLGFERYEMVQILLVEVAGQIVLSLFPGCLLGLGLTHLSMRLIHTETFAFPVVIERSTYALGILSVFLAFIGSSFIVYKLMIRLNLIEALKARE